MFTPIDPNITEMIETQGEIKFFVFESWEFTAAHELFTTVPHKVVYVKGFKYDGGSHHRIFDCKLTLEKHSFIVEDIIHPTKDLSLPRSIPNPSLLTKASEYMFLEMTIKAAEKMAKLSDKERIIITSGLSTFSELASEAGFVIRKPKFSNYFKAAKLLKYEKEKERVHNR